MTMNPRFRRISPVFAASLIASIAIAMPAAAAGFENGASQERPWDDWWVSIGATVGAHSNDVSATVDSRDSTGTPLPLREFASGDDVDLGAILGASLEVASPELPVPLSPRGFVGVEVLAQFAPGRAVANEGSPTGIGELGPPPFAEEEFSGVGSRTRVERDTLSYGVYAGVTIPFEFQGALMSVRPTVRWMRFSYEAEGTILAALKPNPLLPTFRPIELFSQSTIELDAIGPGLEFEVEMESTKSHRTVFFFGGAAYRIVTDNDFSFGTTRTISDSFGTTTYISEHSVEIDEWVGRAHVGIRVHFLDLISRGR